MSFYHESVLELNTKKYEILGELELAKHAILREMSSLDKDTLTRMRSIIEDYGRLEAVLTNKVNLIEAKGNSFVKYAEEMALKFEDEIQAIVILEEKLRLLTKEFENIDVSETSNLVKSVRENLQKINSLQSRIEALERSGGSSSGSTSGSTVNPDVIRMIETINEEREQEKIIEQGHFRKFLAMTGGLRSLFVENKEEHSKNYCTIDSFAENYIRIKCGSGCNSVIANIFVKPNYANYLENTRFHNSAFERGTVYSTKAYSKTLKFALMDNKPVANLNDLKVAGLKFNNLIISYDVNESADSVVNVLLKITPSGMKIIETFPEDLVSTKVTSLVEGDAYNKITYGEKVRFFNVEDKCYIEEIVEDFGNTVVKTFKYGGEI